MKREKGEEKQEREKRKIIEKKYKQREKEGERQKKYTSFVWLYQSVYLSLFLSGSFDWLNFIYFMSHQENILLLD